MKAKFFVLIPLFLIIVFSSSCQQETIRPIGEIVTIESEITGFDALEVANDFKVFVSFSETEESIRLEVDGNVANRVNVQKIGSTLSIKLDNNVNLRGDIVLEAYITTSFLNSIRGKADATIVLENELNHPEVFVKLSGDSKLSGNIQTKELDVELSGDSKMDLFNVLEAQLVDLRLMSDSEFRGGFNSERLDAELSGDSKMMVNGSSISAGIEARGDSEFEDYGFVVNKLNITLRSDSKAQLTVNEAINVVASGDSRLRYQGDAVIESQELSGDSKVVKIN